jgi:hypothetical protein
MINGSYNRYQLLFFFGLSFCGGLLITGYITHLDLKYNEPSIILAGDMIAMISGIILDIAYFIVSLIESPSSLFDFGSLCVPGNE